MPLSFWGHGSTLRSLLQLQRMPRKNERDSATPRESEKIHEEIIKSPGEATIETSEDLPRPPSNKTIHPRRPLPLVPDSTP
jgi:hypothetical protein